MIEEIIEIIKVRADLDSLNDYGYIINSSYATGHNIVISIIGSSSDDSYIVKIPRYPENEKYIENEYEILSYLNKNLTTTISRTIPKPILIENILDNKVLVESFLQGKSLIEYITGSKKSDVMKNVSMQFNNAFDWLINFHNETNILDQKFCESHYNESVLKPIDIFRNSYHSTQEEEKFFKSIENEYQNLIGVPMPFVFAHGDFWLGNIFFHGQSLFVIDWEAGGADSLPFQDIWKFIATASIRLNRSDLVQTDFENHFRFSFFERHWYSELLKLLVGKYCKQTGGNMEFIKKFFSIFLIEMSIREFKKYGKHIGGDLQWRTYFQYFIENSELPDFWINHL